MDGGGAEGEPPVSDIDAGLRELARVVAPGARVVILECAEPPQAIVRALFNVYFRGVLPVIGSLVSGHRTAYRYLPESVANFPDADTLAARMRAAGLVDVGYRRLTFGTAAIHWGARPA